MKRPWSVQVELTEGCTRLCSFCGLNAIRDAAGGFKRMEMKTALRTAAGIQELCPEARIEFAMHGEPLANKNYLKIFRVFRGMLPKAQMQVTTNGNVIAKHMQERLEEIFRAGIDFVVLDTYYPERDSLRDAAMKLTKIHVLDYYDDILPNEGPSPWHNHRRKLNRTVILMDDLGARDGESKARVIVNHAGNNPTLPRRTEPAERTCTLPFREVTVCWNGNVNICCQDWRHQYTVGNVLESRLGEIWVSPEFEAARAHLQNKNREFEPCNVCDIGSGSRSGLLPKYPPLTDADRDLVRKVNRDSPNNGLVQLRKRTDEASP